MNHNPTTNEYLKKADNYYQKAIDLDTQLNYTDALASYNNAKQVYESVINYHRNEIEPSRLNLVENNLKNIIVRISQLQMNDVSNNYQAAAAQLVYPQVPVPPASYAGIQNVQSNPNYMPQNPPLYNQLPSLAEVGNMNSGGSAQASPQTSYPQFKPVNYQQEINQNQQQQQYFYQQQVPNKIPQQQPSQPQTQLYQQPQGYQNLQQPQLNPPKSSNPPSAPIEENRAKNEKGKHFHFIKKKNKSESQKKDDDENEKESSKKKKHDKKHDEKNQQQYEAEHQKQIAQHSQQNSNQFPNQPQQNSNQFPNQPQQNWQQPQQVNQPIQNQLNGQYPPQPQQLMQSQIVQQQQIIQQQQPQSQLYQMPPQSYQQPQPTYQMQQYPQSQQYQMQHYSQQHKQVPSREVSVNQNQNNNQVQNNSDSVSYDSGYDYNSEHEQNSHARKRAHHVLMSDQIIQPKDYKVKRVLGRGANGIVYLVSDVLTGKEYAMKELLHQLISSDEQKSFFREIELMIHANHPAVLKLIGFSMTNLENKNSPILILDLMPNGSLQDIIEKKKKFTLTQKYIALYGIAEAMKYLHSKDIVHRDLKPANVLLNQFDEPAVADFGLSKLMSQELMRQTQAAGSPVYMAPELMMRQDYNNSIDVYAYGYICYELLLEELSFSNTTSVYDLVNMVCNGARPPLIDKNLDEKWKMLISNCWDANPYERPAFNQICQLFLERGLPFNGIDMNRYSQYETKIKSKKI